MAGRTGRTHERVDSDGVRIVKNPGVRTGVWLLVLAMGLVIVGVLVLVRPTLNESAVDPAQHAPVKVAAAGGPRAGQPPAKPLRSLPTARIPQAKSLRAVPVARVELKPAPGAGPTPPGEAEAGSGDTASGERSGIALFPPPGTKPIKRGILVPEDFELPPGYLRHYQATDDGQRVPAILMFHPDYEFVDENGVPVTLPPDRVVPPELAPPGLPIQMLEVSENQVPMIEEAPAEEAGQEPAP
jgi:hypothetical protein